MDIYQASGMSTVHKPDGHTQNIPSLLCMSKIFWTPYDAFGLWQKYSSEAAPTCDPEEHITLEDMADYVESHVEVDAHFGPYPNKDSFLLGDWY